MSFTDSHQELNDHIVPKEYYDRYPLIFSHYHLDRIIVRIGKNEKQKKAITGTSRRSADSERAYKQMDDSWYSSGIYRGTDCIQQQTIASKVPASHSTLN